MARGPSELTGALGKAARSDPRVICGHIEPDHQTLAVTEILREAFRLHGKSFAQGKVLGHIEPKDNLTAMVEEWQRVTTSRASHRASDGPASRKQCPKCAAPDSGRVLPTDPLAQYCLLCQYIWERPL